MQLTDDDLQEFQAVWKRAFKEDLTLDEARHHASQLLELYLVIAKPLPSEGPSAPLPSQTHP